jgi:hypothetical protein
MRAVKDVIGASQKLKSRDIKMIAQCSYWNRTNVRGESDVDVGVAAKAQSISPQPEFPNAAQH